MPGWYIHMDVARKALAALSKNQGAAGTFGQGGPGAKDLEGIAHANPAYVALGAIGPDIFFLLPDFKPPVGTMLWGAATTIRDIYTWWDDNFLGPYEKQLGPIAANTADELAAITGELSKQLSSIFSRALQLILDTLIVLSVRSYDVFGFLGSGVPQGYDEQAFFWSDMLHYRRTYEFAARLWQNASAEKDQARRARFQAFALGWMSHLATDVVGHSFVNEKSGGPYRLHWQRHHLVENHMDARVYDSENGGKAMYPMLSSAARHLWIAFNPDGSSRVDFFQPQPGPDYLQGDDTPSSLDRKSKWDFDSDLPDELAAFVAQTLRDVYPERNPKQPADPKGMGADHPTIISSLQDGHDGYADPDKIVVTYWWLYRYLKWISTDYFKLLHPKPPDVFNLPPFPSPPGTGESDPGPGTDDASDWQTFLDILLAIFAWIVYLLEVAAWPALAIADLITSAGTYPVRELLYESLELPLYNAWLALHWYLSMTGFVSPMKGEISPGLMTLGSGVGDVWKTVQAALADPLGGLKPEPLAGTERSGGDPDERPLPRDVVTDAQASLGAFIDWVRGVSCGAGDTPSEFMRPWLWPDKDNENRDVLTEGHTIWASPFRAPQDATVLFTPAPGDATARHDLAQAKNENETIQIARDHLRHGRHLGDPVDYSGYVVAQLTRDPAGPNPPPPANFNLDSDRGYGYLCWDWLRSRDFMATPGSWTDSQREDGHHRVWPPPGQADPRAYHAPLRPGGGWCDMDLAEENAPPPPPGSPDRPTPHVHGANVVIRYLDREENYPSASGGWFAPMSVASRGADRLDVVARAHGRDVWHQAWDGGNWSAWLSLGGDLASPPQVLASGPQRLDAFALGRDRAVWHQVWDGGKWSGWTSLGGVLISPPYAVALGPSRLDVFALGLDRALWHQTWDGNKWSGWVSLGGTLTSPPHAVSWGPNRLDVFALGLDHGLWQQAWDGNKWSGWASRGGVLGSPPHAVAWGPNRLDVFALGLDSALWHQTWDGNKWTGWASRGGVLTSPPHAVAWGPNRLDVVGLGLDHAVWHQAWDGNKWTGWASIGGALTSSPRVVARASNHLDVFALGLDHALWHRAWDGMAWTGWESRGGADLFGAGA